MTDMHSIKQVHWLQDRAILPLLRFLLFSSPVHPLLRISLLPHLHFLPNRRIDGQLEDFVDTVHFLATAFHVHGAHALRYGLTLFRCHGRKALGFEEVDAGSFGAEVGFEADEDERSGGAKVKDLRIPLSNRVSWIYLGDQSPSRLFTLSMTFSREFGQSMAKQTNRRSVSGYESGRRRSYSSCPAVSHKASSTVFPVGAWDVRVM